MTAGISPRPQAAMSVFRYCGGRVIALGSRDKLAVHGFRDVGENNVRWSRLEAFVVEHDGPARTGQRHSPSAIHRIA